MAVPLYFLGVSQKIRPLLTHFPLKNQLITDASDQPKYLSSRPLNALPCLASSLAIS